MQISIQNLERTLPSGVGDGLRDLLAVLVEICHQLEENLEDVLRDCRGAENANERSINCGLAISRCRHIPMTQKSP